MFVVYAHGCTIAHNVNTFLFLFFFYRIRNISLLSIVLLRKDDYKSAKDHLANNGPNERERKRERQKQLFTLWIDWIYRRLVSLKNSPHKRLHTQNIWNAKSRLTFIRKWRQQRRNDNDDKEEDDEKPAITEQSEFLAYRKTDGIHGNIIQRIKDEKETGEKSKSPFKTHTE